MLALTRMGTPIAANCAPEIEANDCEQSDVIRNSNSHQDRPRLDCQSQPPPRFRSSPHDNEKQNSDGISPPATTRRAVELRMHKGGPRRYRFQPQNQVWFVLMIEADDLLRQ